MPDGWSIAYAFPLDEQRVATLHLPREGLTRDEADRLKDYIDCLVPEDGR